MSRLTLGYAHEEDEKSTTSIFCDEDSKDITSHTTDLEFMDYDTEKKIGTIIASGNDICCIAINLLSLAPHIQNILITPILNNQLNNIALDVQNQEIKDIVKEICTLPTLIKKILQALFKKSEPEQALIVKKLKIHFGIPVDLKLNSSILSYELGNSSSVIKDNPSSTINDKSKIHKKSLNSSHKQAKIEQNTNDDAFDVDCKQFVTSLIEPSVTANSKKRQLKKQQLALATSSSTTTVLSSILLPETNDQCHSVYTIHCMHESMEHESMKHESMEYEIINIMD